MTDAAITSTEAAPPATPPIVTEPAKWYAGLDADSTAYVENKGWKAPSEMLGSYRNIEKLIGVPPDQLVKVPKPESDASAWNDAFTKLGKPPQAKDYQIDMPEGGDAKFADWAKSTFHEAHLTSAQAKAVAGKWNEYAKTEKESSMTAYTAEVAKQTDALKAEWGQAYDQHVNIAKNAAKAFGLDAATIDKLEGGMGFGGLMKFMHGLGTKLGEDKFVGGQTGQGFSGAMTPAQAQARINALRNDGEFVTKYIAGNVESKAEMERLHKMLTNS